MIKLPIKYVIVEGPDCSGKTSLCAALNKAVGFVRNIRDRSYLSTLCYARLYGRDCVDQLRRELRDEICDAGNYLIVMLPSRDVILDRLRARGDEFQDADSLMRLYDIYTEEACLISHLPNVYLVSEALPTSDLAAQISTKMIAYESQGLSSFGDSLHRFVRLSENLEVQFRVRAIVAPAHSDPEVMLVPHEKEYYESILKECTSMIDAEVAGRNPYCVPQDLNSRRFYYSSSSCISSIHFLPRDGNLNVICTLRSTDSLKNGSVDLRFLAHLSSTIAKWHSWWPEQINLEVNYNSLHIRTDVIDHV